jgi:hypothetical protein
MPGVIDASLPKVSVWIFALATPMPFRPVRRPDMKFDGPQI